MKIFDTSGKELARDEIDFSIGRLLQGKEEDTLIFVTWEEQPAEQSDNELSLEKRVSAVEAAIEELMLM